MKNGILMLFLSFFAFQGYAEEDMSDIEIEETAVVVVERCEPQVVHCSHCPYHCHRLHYIEYLDQEAHYPGKRTHAFYDYFTK